MFYDETIESDAAARLNNLAILYADKNEFPAAQAAYDEALALYRRLADVNPQTYLHYVAGTLHNLAILCSITWSKNWLKL